MKSAGCFLNLNFVETPLPDIAPNPIEKQPETSEASFCKAKTSEANFCKAKTQKAACTPIQPQTKETPP